MADWTSDTIPKNIMETLVVDDLAVNYEISAGTIQAKNAATAWVNFDGTTTPPTIRDSFNVSDVVRTATGIYDVYFEEEMDNLNYSIIPTSGRPTWSGSTSSTRVSSDTITTTKFEVKSGYVGASFVIESQPTINIEIKGGKN